MDEDLSEALSDINTKLETLRADERERMQALREKVALALYQLEAAHGRMAGVLHELREALAGAE